VCAIAVTGDIMDLSKTAFGRHESEYPFCTAPDGVKLAHAVSGDGAPLVMSATWLTHLDYQWRSLACALGLMLFPAGVSYCDITPAAAVCQTAMQALFRSTTG
jgi:hypothetical protein